MHSYALLIVAYELSLVGTSLKLGNLLVISSILHCQLSVCVCLDVCYGVVILTLHIVVLITQGADSSTRIRCFHQCLKECVAQVLSVDTILIATKRLQPAMHKGIYRLRSTLRNTLIVSALCVA